VAAIRSRWARLQAWPHQLTVSQFTVVTGLIVIAVGAELLASPLCSSDSFSLWEALFTVTSAITSRASPSSTWAKNSRHWARCC
jgi:hypothetical protein